jgi:hypothetical protein
MKIKIETLEYLVDATDTELNAVKGGYAAIVANDTGSGVKAFEAARIVLGKRAYDGETAQRQLDKGIPLRTIGKGDFLALTAGLGRFTYAVTAAKLEG